MKVNNSGYNQYVQNVYTEKKQLVKKSQDEKGATTQDRIEISDSMKKIKKYLEHINHSQSKAENVEKIKKSLQAGTYRVSSEELADRIIQKMKG